MTDQKTVLLTGHTKGLGAAMYETMTSRGWNVIGYSASTGNDITNPEVRNKIVADASVADVVINNAWTRDDPWAQMALQGDLIKFHNGWSDHILVGTRATDWGLSAVHPHYEGAKDALHRLGKWMTVNTDIRTLILRPGLLDTDKFTDVKKAKINPIEVATFTTAWIASNAHPHLRHVSEAVFSPEM